VRNFLPANQQVVIPIDIAGFLTLRERFDPAGWKDYAANILEFNPWRGMEYAADAWNMIQHWQWVEYIEGLWRGDGE
jgi:hypothetical protein